MPVVALDAEVYFGDRRVTPATTTSRRRLVNLRRSRASSSVVEQGTFNPRVEGSIPSWLTGPHRLEAQDTALSRRLAGVGGDHGTEPFVNASQHTYAGFSLQSRYVVGPRKCAAVGVKRCGLGSALGSKIRAINRRGYCRVGSRRRAILAQVSAPSTHVVGSRWKYWCPSLL